MDGMLKKTYVMYLIPAIIAFVVLTILKASSALNPGDISYPPIVAPFIFFLSVLFALAAPIFYRTVFAHSVRDMKNTSAHELLRFERNLIRIALITPYLGLVAYMLDFSNMYFGGCILMSLYALYYFYPSQSRLAFEKRIFKVRE
jgi:H+/Cl- antiporter ClcA